MCSILYNRYVWTWLFLLFYYLKCIKLCWIYGTHCTYNFFKINVKDIFCVRFSLSKSFLFPNFLGFYPNNIHILFRSRIYKILKKVLIQEEWGGGAVGDLPRYYQIKFRLLKLGSEKVRPFIKNKLWYVAREILYYQGGWIIYFGVSISVS